MTPEKLRALIPNASAETLALTLKLHGADAAEPPKIAVPEAGDGMNKTEREYSRILDAMQRRGEILSWKFGDTKLRLADGCWYLPDFRVMQLSGRVLFVEIKGGHIWDDAKVKFKTAREIHGWADFRMMQKKAGNWREICPKKK